MSLNRAQAPEASSALAKGLRVLTAFGDRGPALGNKEIAAFTGLPKSTVSRLTYTLASLGYLRYESLSARYSLAPYTLTVAKPILRKGSTLRGLLHPLLKDHANRNGIAVGIGTILEGDARYLDACSGYGANGLGFKVGGRLPLASSAMGRALFAAMNERERECCVQRIRTEFQQDVSSRMVSSLYLGLEQISRFGFCTCEGELDESIRGIGVPLRLRQGSSVFALNCGGRKTSVSLEKLTGVIGPETVALASRIASHDLTLPGGH